jgi:DNA-binding LacI/PurR family transcriptional regulator
VATGARRVAFLLHRNAAPSVRLRRDGLAAQIADAHCGTSFRDLASEPDDAAAVSRFLRAWRPDAFVCANDKSAAILMQTLRALGRRIPEDVMVAGFDNIQIACVTTPPLTTVRQPCAEIAETAIRVLAERIANPSLLPREIYLPAPLVVRESTNPSPRPRRNKEKLK